MRILVAILALPVVMAAAEKSKAKPAASDAEIQRAIQARFAKSKVSRNNFQVRVQGGVATLEGATDVVQHKGAATRMAKSAGARAVVNNIKVSDAARKQAGEKLAKVRKATVRPSSAASP